MTDGTLGGAEMSIGARGRVFHGVHPLRGGGPHRPRAGGTNDWQLRLDEKRFFSLPARGGGLGWGASVSWLLTPTLTLPHPGGGNPDYDDAL